MLAATRPHRDFGLLAALFVTALIGCGRPECETAADIPVDHQVRTGTSLFMDLDRDGRVDWLFVNNVDDDGAIADNVTERFGLVMRRGVADLPERFGPSELLWIAEFRWGNTVSRPLESRAVDVDGDGAPELLTRFWFDQINPKPLVVEQARQWRIHTLDHEGGLAEIGRVAAPGSSPYDHFGDFDGDGVVDALVCAEEDGEGELVLAVGPLTSNRQLRRTGLECSKPYRHLDTYRVADFDHDGAMDLAFEADAQSWLQRFVPHAHPEPTPLVDGSRFEQEKAVVADLDGQDGPDTIGLDGDHVVLRLNQRGSFRVWRLPKTDAFSALKKAIDPELDEYGGVADLDGDGRDEIYYVHPKEGLHVFSLKDGLRFDAPSLESFFDAHAPIFPPDVHGWDIPSLIRMRVPHMLFDSDDDGRRNLHFWLLCRDNGGAWIDRVDSNPEG